MTWLNLAAQATGAGAGFKVGIALWFLSGLNRQAKTIKLRPNVLRSMGINRYAAYRGLTRLEEVGLVSVERHPGRAPIVTLLDVEAPE